MAKLTLASFKSELPKMSNAERFAFEYWSCRSSFPEGGILAVASINDAVEALMHLGDDILIQLDGRCNNSAVVRCKTIDGALEWLNTRGVEWAAGELR